MALTNIILVLVLGDARVSAQTPAFPGAEGAGKYVTGGRGTVGTATTVYEVTSLSDANVAGTLRYACSQSATYRTIVFRVSGTIHLTSRLNIPANTTIAGQTAPGDGICLADYWTVINGNNVIIRHVRFRMGDKNQLILDPSVTDTNCWPIWPPFTDTCKPYGDVSGSYDSLGATDKNNLIVDHCSVSWCDDEALSLKNCANTTVQWTIISEPLDYSYHYEGTEADYQEHGYGGIFGATNTSFHHNVFAHCKSRCPRFNDTPTGGTKIRVDMRNNVIYNWRINTAYGGIDGEFNIVSNYYKAGPSTTTDRRIVGTETTARYYLKGNKMVGHDGENGTLSLQATSNNWYGASSGISSEATLSLAEPTLTNVALTTQHTAQETYDIVLATAGANVPKRDMIDARIVNEVKTKTGGIIDVQGGYPHGTPYSTSSNAWPVLLSTTAPTDTDHDGMPDSWETANGLNPGSATDRNTRNAEGYTMLEVYLNSLTLPPVAPTNLVATPGNAVVALTWSLSFTATNYIVKRSTTNGGPYTNIITVATTNYTDTQATNGTTYFYVVSAVSAVGEGTNSVQVSATPQAVATPPDAPLNLAATAGNASITLTWSASATATNYNVKRSLVSGGPYTTTNSVPAPTTNYSDTQVTNGTTYFYVVSAINATGEGADSSQVSAMPQAPSTNAVTYAVFNDGFASGSTLNPASPASPTPSSTGYQIASSKSWSPAPSLTNSHLKFGIGTTTSGLIEAQALFTNAPVVLANVGDTLALTVTFTNTSGLLTQSGTLGFGLYHSGQNQPVPGGMNATVVTSQSDHAAGNAQTWSGYVGHVAFTSGNSQILTRPPQTGTANNNQELLTIGSGSSYANPAGTTVGTAATAPSVTLVAGSPYTDTLTITWTAANTLAITNRLYSGSGTNGALLSQHGAVASGATYLTNAFDALAIGWRATASTSATAIDINQITVQATLVASVSLLRTNLIGQVVAGQVQLYWPPDHVGCRLQIQTNSLNPGAWVDVPNANLTNQVILPVNTNGVSVFFRLIYP
jgi:fibronectin type 3 domain-containing protein